VMSLTGLLPRLSRAQVQTSGVLVGAHPQLVVITERANYLPAELLIAEDSSLTLCPIKPVAS